MPRSVVPILRAPRSSSESASRPRWCGRIRCARSESSRLSPTSTPSCAQLADLLLESHRVDHDAVADHAQDPRVQDPGGDQVQHELAAAHDHRVAGVVPAVVAGDDLDPRGEQVDELALAFVAPLGARDHDVRHGWEPDILRTAGIPQQGARPGASMARATLLRSRSTAARSISPDSKPSRATARRS